MLDLDWAPPSLPGLAPWSPKVWYMGSREQAEGPGGNGLGCGTLWFSLAPILGINIHAKLPTFPGLVLDMGLEEQLGSESLEMRPFGNGCQGPLAGSNRLMHAWAGLGCSQLQRSCGGAHRTRTRALSTCYGQLGLGVRSLSHPLSRQQVSGEGPGGC